MVGQMRQGDPVREEWIVTNLTNKRIAIGDMKTLPELGPRKSLDLLKYVSKEKIGHSKDLQTLIRIGWVSLKKRSFDIPDKNYTVDSSKANTALTEASVYEIEEGILDGTGGSGSIGELSDVDITGILDGQFISWDSTSGQFAPTSSSSTINDINDITNVDINNLENGQILKYNIDTSMWENYDLILYSIEDISNVNIAGITNGQILVWDDYTSSFIAEDQPISSEEVSNLELEGEFKLNSLNSFKELIYTGSNLTTINIWTNSSKTLKLYEKTLSYSGSQLSQMTLNRVSDNKTLTKNFLYTDGNLVSIEVIQS